jgi:hypothetical protein
MSTFTARYPGRCHASCGESIEPGDLCAYVDDQPVHSWCADQAADDLGPMPEPRAVQVCPHCHLVRPCEHDED